MKSYKFQDLLMLFLMIKQLFKLIVIIK